jgi:hypothetical protein
MRTIRCRCGYRAGSMALASIRAAVARLAWPEAADKVAAQFAELT